MIPVDSLLYKIDQKLNKLSTGKHQQIQLEDKILVLNEAQILLIKQKVNPDELGLGMDSTKKRYEDLQNLIEDFKDHKLTLVESDKTLHMWTASLEGITPEYMFYADSYVLADKGRCKDRIIWINKDLLKHGDAQFLINNENYKPSFEYQETFNYLSSDKISIFTDGTFTPKFLYLSYIRYPRYIDKEGYIKLDGTPSSNQDCELKKYLEDELLDLTVELLAMYTENSSAIQSAKLRIQASE